MSAQENSILCGNATGASTLRLGQLPASTLWTNGRTGIRQIVKETLLLTDAKAGKEGTRIDLKCREQSGCSAVVAE